MQKVTIALVFDQKKVQDSNYGIVKIRATYKREKRFFTTGIKSLCSDWQRLSRMKGELGNRIKDDNFIDLYYSLYGSKDVRNGRKEGWLSKARNVAEQISDDFTFDTFKYKLANYGKETLESTNNDDVIKALIKKQDSMQGQDRIGSASLYGLVAKSLLRFISQLSDKERLQLGLSSAHKRFSTDDPQTLTFKQVTIDFLNRYEA